MRSWRLWLGVALTLCGLALALAGIDLRAVGEALRLADWRFFLPATAMLLGFLLARSARWRLLLGSDIGLADAFAITSIGYLVSNVLPLRLGDPARAAALGLTGKARVSRALSTVVVERVLDLLAVIVTLVAVLPFVPKAGWIRVAGAIAGVAGAAAFLLLIVIARRPQWGLDKLRGLIARVPRVDPARWTGITRGLVDGLSALGSGSSFAGLIGWSAITWACSVACYLALLRAFVGRPTLVQAAFLSSAVGLGVALPSAPGATGVFHSVARYALEIPFAFPRETALTVAFASHAFMYLVMSGLGVAGLAAEGISMSRLRASLSGPASEDQSHA
jgi:uncharacterized protein (TIRG00374 family)